VSSSEATLAAFCSAARTTFVGSITPASGRSARSVRPCDQGRRGTARVVAGRPDDGRCRAADDEGPLPLPSTSAVG
jgi:hypothetical protein